MKRMLIYMNNAHQASFTLQHLSQYQTKQKQKKLLQGCFHKREKKIQQKGEKNVMAAKTKKPNQGQA